MAISTYYLSIIIMQYEPKTWKLALRVNYHREHLFKIKPTAPNTFIMHLPAQKTIQTFDMALNPQQPTYKFTYQMNAIEQIQLNSGTFMVAGSKDGQIQLQNVNQTDKYLLTPETLMERDSRYINDFVVMQNSRLVNCYNNGAVATWNLNQQLSNDIKPASYNLIHESFFYKIRKIDERTILTASNDFTAKIYDLESDTVVDSFGHVNSVWCAYPLNQRMFCTAGLMDSLVFWDSRAHRIVSRCRLRNQQTSFVTRYDENNVIFGDGNEIALCDLRKPIKREFTQHRMTVSAETILVGENEVIVAGRGGDLCLLKNGGSQIQAEQRNVGNPTLSPMMRFFQMMRLNMNNRFQMINNQEEQDDEEDVEDFDQEELDALEEQFLRENQQSESEGQLLMENQRKEENSQAVQSNQLISNMNSSEVQVDSGQVGQEISKIEQERDGDQMEIQVADQVQQIQKVEYQQVPKQQSPTKKAEPNTLLLPQHHQTQQPQVNNQQQPLADKK